MRSSTITSELLLARRGRRGLRAALFPPKRPPPCKDSPLHGHIDPHHGPFQLIFMNTDACTSCQVGTLRDNVSM